MADFYICGDKLDFDEINFMMNIFNSKIRKSSSFTIKEFAKDYWSFNTGYEACKDINVQIAKIQRQIENKLKVINEINKKFNSECGFVIAIKIENVDSIPAIYFENSFIKMISHIDASINIDFT